MTHQDRLGDAIDPRRGLPAGGKVHGQPGGFSVSQGAFCRHCNAWRGTLGLEPTPELYVKHMVQVFREVRRVLRSDGTVWLNLGDSYSTGTSADRQPGTGDCASWTSRSSSVRMDAGLKPKDLVGIPWRVAFALQADGWWLRSAITWCKGSPMPESVRDRPTKATEMVFLLSKSSRYFWDADAVRWMAKSLNPRNSINEPGIVTQRSSAHSLTAESSQIPLKNQIPPYLVLGCLLASQGIAVEERNDGFSQCLDAFKSPMADWAAMFTRLEVKENTAEVLVKVLQNWEVVVSELNLNTEAEFWVSLFSALAKAIVGVQASFTVKEAYEVVAKLIGNVKVLRQTFAFDALLEGRVNVNLIDQSIALFDCTGTLASHGGDGLVTTTTSEKLSFLFGNLLRDLRQRCIGHDSTSTPNYTTEVPTGQRNIWDWWVINSASYSGSHFATFPRALVEPCILAGTSERGACPACGAPWERVVEREEPPAVSSSELDRYGTGKAGIHRKVGGQYQKWLDTNPTLTIGWRPSCSCYDEDFPPHESAWPEDDPKPKKDVPREAWERVHLSVIAEKQRLLKAWQAWPTVPCLILDPFCGTGTVGEVAIQHRRRFVGLDLSRPYLAELATERLAEIDVRLF